MTWRGHLRADPLGWLLATDTPAVRAAALQRLGDRPADAGTGRGRRSDAMKTLAHLQDALWSDPTVTTRSSRPP